MKRSIAIFAIILMLFTTMLYPIAAHAQLQQMAQMPQAGDIQQADADARRDAHQNVSTISWGIGGFFCGLCAVAYVYIDKPQVPTARLVGKSAEYVSFYTDTYKREVRKQRGQSAMIGCLAGSIFSTLTYYLSRSLEY